MRKLKHSEIPTIRESIKIAQGNKCPLCLASFTDAKMVKRKLVPKYQPALDHDHATGHIRGVLCTNCNGMEGKIKNRVNRAKRELSLIQWLENLLKYWKQHNNPKTVLIHPTHKTDDEKRLAINKKARLKRAQIKAAKILQGK